MNFPVPLASVAAARSFEQRDVAALAVEAGLGPADLATLRDNGLAEVPVATADLPGLIAEVLRGLEESGWRTQTCSWAIFTHSLPMGEADLEGVDRLLRAALPSLARRPLLLTGRPCSIIHYGIELAAALCRKDLCREDLCRQGRSRGTALVLGADIAPAHEERFFFGSAMGDAAVGLALGGEPAPGGEPALGRLLAARSFTYVVAPDGESSDPEQIARFRTQNPAAIRAAIGDTLRETGLSWDDLAAIVPHTPNRLIWDTVAVLSHFPRRRILDHRLPVTGHLNSNDVLVHFASAARQGLFRGSDVIALVSPGFGGTRGCTLIRYGALCTSNPLPARKTAGGRQCAGQQEKPSGNVRAIRSRRLLFPRSKRRAALRGRHPVPTPGSSGARSRSRPRRPC
jgi:3-oxoacyl-[acyl-carrier-protein] synthase-3